MYSLKSKYEKWNSRFYLKIFKSRFEFPDKTTVYFTNFSVEIDFKIFYYNDHWINLNFNLPIILNALLIKIKQLKKIENSLKKIDLFIITFLGIFKNLRFLDLMMRFKLFFCL